MFGTKRARQVRIVAALGTVLGLAMAGVAFARSLQKISIEREGDTRVIAVEGMAEASYAASRAERPRRIVLDFDDVQGAVFNYPTLSEAYRIAALDGLNRL